MKLNAYVLLSEPYWVAASIRSYYDLVEKIVVSYDGDHTGWTGRDLDIGRSLDEIRAADVDGKCVLAPGSFYRVNERPMQLETEQRQAALDVASSDADWVIALDTDELVANSAAFLRSVNAAADAGLHGLEYPARWVYAQVGAQRYLERCDRAWRPIASYPGCVATRAGVRLSHARQIDLEAWHVDLRARNTDPYRDRAARIHEVIPPEQAIIHMSFVRPEAALRAKSLSSGHAFDFDWEARIDAWARAQRHPVQRCILAPLQPRRRSERMRFTTLELEVPMLVGPDRVNPSDP